jgi:predicted HicB family RNase H-like nuclease
MKVLSLRIEDDGVHKRLVDEAKKEHRSLNAHINHLLTRHVHRVEVKGKEGK